MNLYKLEQKKIKWSTYLWAAGGIFLSILAIGILFVFIAQTEEGDELFADWNGLAALTTALGYCCFGILSAVMGSKVIVNDYCGKIAVVMLSYPVGRKEVLGTKIRLVCLLTVFSACVSHLLTLGGMYAIARIFQTVPEAAGGYGAIFRMALLSGILMGCMAAALGIVSAVAGWIKRSSTAAIICALLLVCATTNLIAISPRHLIGIMTAMSVLFAASGIGMYRLLANGIENMEV
ncbi:MAG: ABC transporter permease [Lachnospiraceae bacterium]|jgi:ABC-type transport system involved in multi-copper enzyme maturation permease subunit|uniref:ABC transporter permease n=1 Tax=Candidatus Merdisoma sp. JLR.KK006 TaxID=3112626 RepID=UPI002FEF09FE|nr:ABC transporter permease [Lachnospiraceae bacterium]